MTQGAVFGLLVLLVALSSGAPLNKKDVSQCGYNACTSYDPEAINVHLIAHSHDDVGWNMSVQGYFNHYVVHIITTMVEALLKNPERKFVQAETEFFKLWWDLQNEDKHNDVRTLINEGRLQIANGAWSSNDEANVHYQSTIDQFTDAYRFLIDNLGECANPKVAWQVDPFGHSREHASLSAQMGLDGIMFARIDYRDRETRHANGTMDLMWNASPNLGSSSDIFASSLNEHYNSPDGFGFDKDKPENYINDDPNSDKYNLMEKLDNFVNVVEDRASHYPTNNIPVTMGDDFQFVEAEIEFSNLDKLINGLKNNEKTYQDKKINVFYSTPACYVKAVNDYVNANNHQLTQKSDDFFPYASSPHGVWSGYFTSRAASKRYERIANNILQVTKQLSAVTNTKHDNEGIAQLREKIGIMQHHDAITGTEKTDVMENYHVLLSSAIDKATTLSNKLISDILKSNGMVTADVKIKTCHLVNVSHCEVTSTSDEVTVIVYNPYSHVGSQLVQLPVNEDNWQVSSGGKGITIMISDPIRDFSYMDDTSATKRILSFYADNLPPLGLKIYSVKKSDKSKTLTTRTKNFAGVYGNNDFNVELDSDGELAAVTINGHKVEVKQEFLFYTSSAGDEDNSGAYIFRPAKNTPTLISEKPTVKVLARETYYIEIRQEFDNWVTQIIRLHGSDSIEFDWVVGPIPNQGQEIITRFTTNLTKADFYTDTNGREMIQRIRNFRSDYEYTNEEPVAGNYYPITSKATLKDEANNLQLSIINDRPQGGASLADGQLELMLHRRCILDDYKGVGQALNEFQYGIPLVVRGQFSLTVGAIKPESKDERSASQIEKDIAHRKFLAPWVFLSTDNEAFLNDKSSVNLLRKELPENVKLLTLEPWNDNVVLIRFEHIFDKAMGEANSEEVTFSVGDLFEAFDIRKIKETTLAANVLAKDSKRLAWPGSEQTVVKNDDSDSLTVTLKSMEIKTYLATVQYDKSILKKILDFIPIKSIW